MYYIVGMNRTTGKKTKTYNLRGIMEISNYQWYGKGRFGFSIGRAETQCFLTADLGKFNSVDCLQIDQKSNLDNGIMLNVGALAFLHHQFSLQLMTAKACTNRKSPSELMGVFVKGGFLDFERATEILNAHNAEVKKK